MEAVELPHMRGKSHFDDAESVTHAYTGNGSVENKQNREVAMVLCNIHAVYMRNMHSGAHEADRADIS